MMYNQWIREGKAGQDSGQFLDLSQWARWLDSFFIKMPLISWVRLCSSCMFTSITVYCTFLTALQTKRENFNWLVVSFLLLCVSLLSAWAQQKLPYLALASSLITVKMDESCCAEFSFESYSILLPAGLMNGEFDFWNGEFDFCNEEFDWVIPKANLSQISLLLLPLWNFISS